MILKDIKEEIVKNYFKLNENARRIYHINHKNNPKKRFYVIKKKIHTKCKEIIIPIKKKLNNFIDNKILHLKEVPDVGFEKLLNYKENIDFESENFRKNEIKNYCSKIKKIIKIKYNQILIKLKEKFEKNNITNQSKGLNNFFDVKKKIISKIIEKKEKKLKEKYPEYKEPDSFEKTVNYLNKFKSGGIGLIKSLINVFRSGYTTSILAEKNNIENVLQISKNIRYNEFQEELKAIEKDREKSSLIILSDDIKYLCKLSSEDEKLFLEMKENKKNELKEITEEKMYFLPDLLEDENENTNELRDNDNINNNCDLNISLLDPSDYNDDEALIKT